MPTRVWAEVPDDLAGYLPAGADVTWLAPPGDGGSALAEVVEAIDWPAGDGYFWMAGESAQMRAIRKHLMREAAAGHGVRRDGLLARRRRTPAPGGRPGPDLAGRQGGREVRRADLGRRTTRVRDG